jgi:hypothetical protein
LLGIEEKLVPHSVRATAATQLFNHGVSEQLIAETTGHQSDAIRVYKHTSLEQTLNVQKALAPSFKRNVGAINENNNNNTSSDMDIEEEETIRLPLKNRTNRNNAYGTQNNQNTDISSSYKNTNNGQTSIHR